MIKDLSIPVFTGIIGYITNWSGIWMLFNPLEFKGFTFPGLKYLAKLAPRKVQQIPGVMHGGVGWQGIIPSRAAKMGSIAVDKTIAKIGSASDFYESLDPEAARASTSSRTRATTSASSSRRRCSNATRSCGATSPPRSARPSISACRTTCRRSIREVVVDRIGGNIDQLLDVKLMVISTSSSGRSCPTACSARSASAS